MVCFAARSADALRRDLAPAAGRGAEIHHLGAWLEQVKLVVDFGKLEGRTGSQPLPLGVGYIGIVKLAFQPQLGGQRTAPAAANPHLEIARAAAGFGG